MRRGVLREGSAERLTEILDRLKSEGCSVLVAGELPEPVQQLVSQRVLGAQHLDRVRVLTLLGPTSDVDSWFPGQVSATAAQSYVIDRWDLDRSVAVSSVGGAFGPSQADSDSLTPGDESDSLTSGDESDSTGAEDGPGVARAVADDLDSILGEWDVPPTRLRLATTPANGERPGDEAIRAFVESMNATEGMAYLFLPGMGVFELDPDVTDRVDAVIEVRTRRPGAPEHRWIIPEEEVMTGWMPVES